jgi:hypothetical protein
MEHAEDKKLNKQGHERAYETAFEFELTQEQLQKLIQAKFERARIYREAAEGLPTFDVN